VFLILRIHHHYIIVFLHYSITGITGITAGSTGIIGSTVITASISITGITGHRKIHYCPALYWGTINPLIHIQNGMTYNQIKIQNSTCPSDGVLYLLD